jgi:simple sugar transport system ATP-binding protein
LSEPPLLELRQVSKAYPGTLALDRVDLALRPGEIRALLGENGAGKSTLTGVLFGHVRPDSGEVRVAGQPVAITSPLRALELGIGLVHQHFALAPSLTVAENVVLGTPGALPRSFDRSAAIAETRALSERTGLAVDPGARTGDLPVGVRQRVEILKVLRRNVRVLLLDEPTAVLAPKEVEELFLVLERFRAEGRSIVFITHKLDEVARIAQRVTILRRGRVVAPDLDAKAVSREELAALMIGEALPREAAALPLPREAGEGRGGGPVLALRNVSASGRDGRIALREVSLEVRPGELVGIAGVAGNGQEELFELATGLLAPSHGTVLLRGSPVAADPATFAREGVAAIPGDRHAFALATTLSCEENLALKEIATGESRLGLIDRRHVRATALARMEAYDVRPRDPTVLAGKLSGGNQQKLVLARELEGEPSLVVALDPARGLDVRATALVARELERARARGAAVLLISTDLDEVLALATRACALHAGRVVGASKDRPDRDELGLLMLSGAPAAR